MSSPHLSPRTIPSQERKIAPLPSRARHRSSGGSQNVLSTQGTPSPSPSITSPTVPSRERKTAPLPVGARSGSNGSSQNTLSTRGTPSPPYTPPTLHTPPQGRKIAPLPQRSKSRSSGTPGSSQNALTSNRTPSPSSSSEAIQTLSTAAEISPLRRGYQSPVTTLNARQISPPALDFPGIGFQFGQQESNSVPIERQETYTLRLLHNITPRPSLEPEESKFPVSDDFPAGLKYSSLPEIATLDHEISQPVHTIYSDEKIGIPDASEPLEQGIPTIVEDHLETTAATSHASSARSPSLLWGTQVSELSASPGLLRQRSISDASDVSDNNEHSDSIGSYDVRDEEAPLEPFFTSVFQTALRNGLVIANKVVSAIENLASSSEPSSDLERLSKDARNLGTFESSDTRTIAVLGDSGEGNLQFLTKINCCS